MSGNQNNKNKKNANKSTAPPMDGQLAIAMQGADISGNDDKPAKLPFELQQDGQPKINPEDKKDKDPSFYDEEYAVSNITGTQGEKLDIRVNRLAISYNLLPKEFYCYSVALPRISGRVVTKRHIKKFLMRETLITGQPWSAAFASNKIFTDWDSLIVTADPKIGLPTQQGDKATATFPFRNQSDPPGTAPTPVTSTITCLAVISRSGLTDYLGPDGINAPTFNHSVWMRIFNMMLKHFAAQANNTITIGNKLFRTVPSNAQRLPSGLLPQQGFFASVRPVNKGLQVHFNTAAAAFFPAIPLHKFLQGYFGPTLNLESVNGHLRAEIVATITGLKVRYMYNPPDPDTRARSPPLANAAAGRLKTVNSLGGSADAVSRPLQGYPAQTSWTVEQHFNTNVLTPPARIQCPKLPLINVGPKSTPQNRNAEVWIPMELLMIEPNQPLRTTVPENDMTPMATHSRRRPLQNVALLEGAGLQLLQRSMLIQHRVMQIAGGAGQLMHTVGRFLPLPELQYRGQGRAEKHRMKSGRWDLKRQKFRSGTKLDKLLVIIVADANLDKSQVQQTLNKVARGLDGYGVECTGAQFAHAPNAGSVHLSAAYDSFRQPSIRTVLVILPRKDFNMYSEVKTWGELGKGVNTICVTKDNATRSLHKPDFQGNLALKFNAKLGGKNHTLGNSFQGLLHWESGATMVVGADVTHPGPSSIEYCPSIAAVVASQDKDCVQFPGSMRLQASRTETILDMQGMMVERLRHWKVKNKDTLPDSILYYRDGVSESQFAMVKQQELSAIRAAYTQVAGQDAKVAITVVVCTKRHQTRFYPRAKQEDLGEKELEHFDRNMNFNNGLVVDDPAIRGPHYFDFYLQGHQALQGTARPCHYFVIENGMDFGPDDLQMITYGLSWVYATSLTPISLAAPAYYADKLCERGRAWLRPLLVRGHGLRPTPQQVAAIIAPLGQHATDQQKRNHVAAHYASGQNAGPVIFWPRNGTLKNPCHQAIEDTMFYV
ncbi:hypothetical protein CLAFUW4_14273 [Fulvia fulva]|uniref:Piwi domain-containing protein n=1 Tax=Passalora fulva TaxID=5499 RepID=A0A9Q8UWG8_PASFU|nr:uncharacterized protein CLAFUR5_14106 [Fulvia fulva]UJO25001.1 hypothetical protein CLAFUR5_14106 [Fulvia fulva]WPV22654.1 hypothetical protein CLAFUW4_14273 [Fulvia fulva]